MHFVEREVANEVLCDILILQSIVDKIVWGDTAFQYLSHLVHHSLVQSGGEALGDAFATQIPRNIYAKNHRFYFRHLHPLEAVRNTIILDFDGTDNAAAVVEIGCVVGLIVGIGEQFGLQLVGGEVVKGGAEGFVDGDFEQLITAQNSLDIQSCAATEYRLNSTRDNIEVGGIEVTLEHIEIVFEASGGNIDKVIGDFCAVDDIFGEVFSRSDVHLAVDLTGIGAEDFALQTMRNSRCHSGFARCGGSQDYEEFHSGKIFGKGSVFLGIIL